MEEEIIKKIKEKIIQPFYDFPNPISIELNDKDVNLIEELIDLYIKLQYKLEVEKIDNKYNQEERDEETIPRYKILEKIKEEKEGIKRDLENIKKIDDENWKKAIEQSINIRNRKIEFGESILED